VTSTGTRFATALSAALLAAVGLATPALAGDDGTAAAQSGAEPAVGLGSILTSPAGMLPSGPRSNGTGVLPDGRFVTPVGRSVQVDLEPQHSELSHDGRRLYVSSEGVDDDPPTTTDHDHTRHARYFSVLDTVTLAVTRVEDDALHAGLADTADGLTLYVAEGQTDSIGVFTRTPAPDGGVGTYAKTADWPLDPTKPTDYPDGLVLSPAGDRLYVTGFSGDTLTTVSTVGGAVLGRTGTGAYPYTLVLSPDGTRAYVSNMGLYNGDASLGLSSPIAPPPGSIGGYDSTTSASVWTYDITGPTPTVVAATKVGEPLDGADVDGGSSPSGLALSPDGRTLAVAASGDDQLALLDTTRTVPSTAVPSSGAPAVAAHPVSEVDLRALVGSAAVAGPTGAQPDAPLWSPDGKVLFVGEGERNDVVVINPLLISAPSTLPDPTAALGDGPGSAAGPNRDAVVGRIPTAWYPTSLAISPDGGHLFVTTMKGLGAGPNSALGPVASPPSGSEPAVAYIPNTIHGRVSDVELSAACAALPSLTASSDADNGLVLGSADRQALAGDGSVIPTSYGAGPSTKIKHVFLIIKENRPFDQVLGDQPGVEADQRFTAYPQRLTPNTHAIASQFSVGDNYYATTETSTQGHYAIDTGQVNEFVDKVTPSSYALKYPYGPFDTTPENLPEGGFIWNNAARHGVRSTIYGEGTFVVGVAPALLGQSPTTTSAGQLVPGVQQNALTTYDALYPSQANLQGNLGPLKAPVGAVYGYNDEARASAFARPDGQAEVAQLNVMVLFDDHTDGDIAGAQTPERQVAENDHGLGRVLDTISHSSYWSSSAVFVTEDDTQGGQDHVDAYRTYGLVASPYAKRGHVSHVHTSFSSMTKTINLILGLPPTSLQEAVATPLSDDFISGSQQPDETPYTALANSTQPDANRPLAQARNPTEAAAARLALSIPPGIDRGGAALPLDLALDRSAELQAGDLNVAPVVTRTVHTLAAGSPDPVTLGPPAPTGDVPATDGCLRAQGAPPSTLAESRIPTALLLGAGVVLAAGTTVRRRRRLRA